MHYLYCRENGNVLCANVSTLWDIVGKQYNLLLNSRFEIRLKIPVSELTNLSTLKSVFYQDVQLLWSHIL